MNGCGKSDGCVVPAKLPNNAGVPVAEVVEGRRPAEGNAASTTRPGLRAGTGAPSALDRVRYRAQQDKGTQFTALLHRVHLFDGSSAHAGHSESTARPAGREPSPQE